MPFYYINKNWTLNPGFHHEVHTEEHAAELKIQDKIYLGWFANEIDAVQEGKKHYSNADGCAVCRPKPPKG